MARPTTTTSRPAARAARAAERMRPTLDAKVVTATRPGALATSSASVLATSFADGVGGIADQGKNALVAERPQPSFVSRRADDRRRVDLPVTGMQDGAERRADDQGIGFRNRMGDRHVFELESTDREAPAERDDLDRDLRSAGLALALGLKQCRRERRGVDRNLQLRPQVQEGADMILMGMGEDDAGKVSPLLDEITDVRIDEVDPRKVLLAGDRHADINREPGPAALLAHPVDREIHPDLADPAQGREDELIAGGDHAGCASGNTSPAAMAWIVPSANRRTRRPAPSSVSNRPSSSWSPTRTRVGPLSPAARCSQSARTAGKPFPRSHCARRSSIVRDNTRNRSRGSAASPCTARSVAGNARSDG